MELRRIPIQMIQQFLILVVESALCLVTIFSGLLVGKLIVLNVDNAMGSLIPEGNPNQIYKEVGVGVIVTLLILRYLTVPIARKVVGFLENFGRDDENRNLDCISLPVVIAKFLFLALCYTMLLILFEFRYCKKTFSASMVQDPIQAMAYYLDSVSPLFHKFFSTGFDLISPDDEFEAYFLIPLTLAFIFPIYRLLKYYWMHESEDDERESGKTFSEKLQSLKWTTQFCATMIELAEYFIFNAILFASVNILGIWDWKLGSACTLLINPIASFLGFAMIGFESAIPKLSALGGNKIRIYLNMLYLAYFIPRTFSLYFQEGPNISNSCDKGQLDMTSQVSRDFAIYSAICVYAAWKILFLCKSYVDSKEHESKMENSLYNKYGEKNTEDEKLLLV